MMETAVHFFGFPAQVLRILGHLQARCSHTSGVHRFTRCKKYAIGLEEMNGTRLTTHITYLAAAPAAVGFQLFRILFAQLVLERARQGDVARNRPRFLAFREDALFRELVRHVLHFVAVRRTHDEHVIDHLFGDTVFDSHYAVRSGDSYHFGAQLDRFCRRTPRYVAETGDSDRLALDIFACLMQQMLREIECAETRCFRAQDRTSPRHTLAGQHAGMILARQFLVHAVEESYLTSADAYVTCRYILIRTDAAP